MSTPFLGIRVWTSDFLKSVKTESSLIPNMMLSALISSANRSKPYRLGDIRDHKPVCAIWHSV